jgi:hypothetical protein
MQFLRLFNETYELWIRKDMERIGCDLSKVLAQRLRGGTEENYEKIQNIRHSG